MSTALSACSLLRDDLHTSRRREALAQCQGLYYLTYDKQRIRKSAIAYVQVTFRSAVRHSNYCNAVKEPIPSTHSFSIHLWVASEAETVSL